MITSEYLYWADHTDTAAFARSGVAWKLQSTGVEQSPTGRVFKTMKKNLYGSLVGGVEHAHLEMITLLMAMTTLKTLKPLMFL